MKIEIGNKTKTIPLSKLDCGSLFATCVYCYENGSEEEEVLVYLYMSTDESYIPNAVAIYPEKYRGKQNCFSSEQDVIPLVGTLEIDNLPTVSDFYE